MQPVYGKEKGLISPYVYPGLMSTIVVDGKSTVRTWMDKHISALDNNYVSNNRVGIIASIIKKICDLSGYDYELLCKKCRKREHVFPRAFICYYMRKRLIGTFSEIGKALGGRDHTTIIHSCRLAESLMEMGYSDVVVCMRRIQHAINTIALQIELGKFESDGAR